MYEYEATIIELINSAIRSIKVLPLVLGGVTDSGGGSGGPPGGFVGQLPQARVTYDTDESADYGTPTSGMSILDNLNHIRARIEDLEVLDANCDDKEGSGEKVDLFAGTTIDFGEVCYMGSDGKMEKNDASSSSTCRGWAMALADVSEDAEGNFILRGFVTNSDWSWSSVGNYIYADPANPGGMTQIIPSGAYEMVQILGVAIASTKMYFKPELSQVEHA